MTREEAFRIADKLQPNGYRLNALELQETPDGYEWKATYVQFTERPTVVIERWDDFYTDNDPEPTTDEGDATDEETEETEEVQTRDSGSEATGEQEVSDGVS